MSLGALNDGGTARSIVVTGGGSLTLTLAATSISPGTTLAINNNSTVNSNATGAIGSASQVSVNSAAAAFNAGATQQISSLSGTGFVGITGGATLTVGNPSDNLSSVYNGIVQGAGALAKSGTGTVTLANLNAYGGGTTVNAGTLISSTTSSLGTGNVTLNGGTLRVGGVAGPSVNLTGFGGTSTLADGTGTSPRWFVNNNGITSNPIASDVLTLTDGVNGEARSAWFNSTVPFVSGSSGFTASFTYTPSGPATRADGMTFVLQGQGTTALGAGGGGLGYSTSDQANGIAAITPSVAYEINLYNGHTVGTNFVTSNTVPATLFFNTVDGTQPGGLNVNSFTGGTGPGGDPIAVILSYDPVGHTMTENLTDTLTNATYSHVYSNVDISRILNSTTAFVGFTGATGGSNSTQMISDFSFNVSPPAPADIYNNNVLLTGGVNATIDVAITSNGETISMGNLSIGNGAGTTLNVTATTAPTNFGYTLAMGNTTLAGNVGINVANNGLGAGTLVLGSLSTGGGARTLTKGGAGTLEVDGSPTIDNNSAFVVNTGTLRFNNNVGAATIGTGVNVTVNGSSTLELAGTAPSLSDGLVAADRAHVQNSSTSPTGILVSGQSQQVGGIDGTGTTHVDDGSDLTADHIIQGALVIGDTGANPSLVTIAASDANGNPMAGGLAIAGSLAHSTPLGGSSNSSSVLAPVDGSGAGPLAASAGGAVGSGSAAVPEPSSLLLLVAGGLACLTTMIRRRKRA